MKSKTKTAKPKYKTFRIRVLKKHDVAARKARKTVGYDCLSQCLVSQALKDAGYKKFTCGYYVVKFPKGRMLSLDFATSQHIRRFMNGRTLLKPFTAILTERPPIV